MCRRLLQPKDRPGLRAHLAFLAIVGEERPDFRTISLFRKTHLDAFADVFVQVLRLAKAAGLVSLGTIAVDGTKVQGNASRHKAMSYGYMTKEVDRLRAETDQLLKQARDVDAQDDAALGTRSGDELPEQLRRRLGRLATIEAAMERLEAEARAEAEAEQQRRDQAEAQRNAGGRSVVVGYPVRSWRPLRRRPRSTSPNPSCRS